MKTKRIIILTILISIIGFYSCEEDNKNEKPDFKLEHADNITTEEYEIYSLVIIGFNSEKIVIQQKTNMNIYLLKDSYFYDILINNNTGIDSNLITNYFQMNDSSYYLDNNFVCSGKEVYLISTAEIQYIFNDKDINDGWEEFYNEYPNSTGIVKFTRIGFNENQTQAILEIGQQYESLGGLGSIIYLEKVNNIWIITDRIGTWIS